jgi:hypothetical protein
MMHFSDGALSTASVERLSDAEIKRVRAHGGIETVLDEVERHHKLVTRERERLRPEIRIAIFGPRTSQWLQSATSMPPPSVQPSLLVALFTTGNVNPLLAQEANPQVEVTSKCCMATLRQFVKNDNAQDFARTDAFLAAPVAFRRRAGPNRN